MAIIKPFNALRFTKQAGEISTLTCPPYDIVSEKQKQEFLKINPYNIIRLELPSGGDARYVAAGDILKEWMDSEIVALDEKAGLYIYEEKFVAYGKEYSIKGFACTVKLEEFASGVILPHEETLSKAKTDRLNLMETTSCNLSSIYSLYFDEENAVDNILEEYSKNTPDMHFADGDGTIHNVWCVYDEEIINKVCAIMADKKLYIADGHHRYETALSYRNHLKETGVITSENHPANYMMMTLMNISHKGLVVFPTHRIVKNLENFDVEKLLNGCEQYFDIIDCPVDEIEKTLTKYQDKNEKAVGIYSKNRSCVLVLKNTLIMNELLPTMSTVFQQLDVCILHTLILERLLAIDKENMANQKNLIYTRSLIEAIEAVDKEEANLSFIINATKVKEIADIAGAGEKMPQKSTYFYPKLITGHVMNLLQ